VEKVSVVKCQCGDWICDKHGLSYGDFYQGCGWSKRDAEEIAHRINAYEMMYATLKKIAKKTRKPPDPSRADAIAVLNAVDSKNYVL
jgi:hypothetical protein